MKLTTILSAAVAGLLCVSLLPAQGDQEELQQKLDDKLAKSFVSHGGWITDYDKARQMAADSGKLIFVYFTRSYAP